MSIENKIGNSIRATITSNKIKMYFCSPVSKSKVRTFWAKTEGVLICTDDDLDALKIHNAQHLMHYTVNLENFAKFMQRFSVLLDMYGTQASKVICSKTHSYFVRNDILVHFSDGREDENGYAIISHVCWWNKPSPTAQICHSAVTRWANPSQRYFASERGNEKLKIQMIPNANLVQFPF